MNETQRLLQDYARGGSERAFGEIVRRYLDLVYSVAVRRAGGDAHRAEDIVQTVFSDLARKAGSLPPDIMLGGWLHRHCCFVASNVLRAESRRAEREREASFMNAMESGSETRWDGLAPVIDDAIQELPAPDRDALVLRFFEKRDFRAVGGALGISDDAAQKRVSRALEKLRHLLAGRGVTLTALVLGNLLAVHTIAAAPAEWVERISTRALHALPVKTAALASLGGLLSLLGFKGAVTAVLVAGAVIAGLWKFKGEPSGQAEAQEQRGGKPAMGLVQPSLASAPAAAEVVDEEAEEANFNGLRLMIVSAETGEPLPNVPVEYRSWIAATRKFAGQKLTGRADGLCLVPLPDEALQSLELTTHAEGYADTRLMWHPARGQEIPEAYTLKLPRGTPIGGTVVGPDGQPVAGAEVGFNHNEDPVQATLIESPLFGWMTATTDQNGRWQMTRIADEMVRRVRGGASHPDYAGSPYFEVQNLPEAEKELRAGTHVMQLGQAATARGLVVDSTSLPIPGANVLVGPRGSSGSRKGVTELDGTFEIKGCRPGETPITAEAPQYAPTTVKIQLSTNSEPVRLVLQRGKILRMRVVDAGGAPIEGASIWLNTFANRNPMSATPSGSQAQFNPKTDRDGRIFWDQAPDEDLVFGVSARGHMRSRDITIRPDGTEHTVVLQPALRISGTVRDAETGRAIPSFKLITGWPQRNFASEKVTPQWSTIDRFWLSFAEGKFEHLYEEAAINGPAEIEFMFKIEAEGYASHISRVVNAKEQNVVLDVALEKASSLKITVVQPDGSPAADTDVVFAGPMQHVRIAGNGFERGNANPVSTDQHGQVSWMPDEHVLTVYAANARGFAQASPAEVRAHPILRLQEWGRVDGTYTRRGKPVVGRGIVVSTRDPGDFQKPWLHVGNPVKTDAQGRFVFNQVPPGRHKLDYLAPSQDDRNSFSHVPFLEIEVVPGQTAQINYDNNALEFQVRLIWPESIPHREGEQIFATLRTPVPMPPPEILKDPEAIKRWWQIPEHKAAAQAAKHYRLSKRDGNLWSTEEAPPGNYILAFHIFVPNSSNDVAIGANKEIGIPEDWPHESFDAGEVVLSMNQVPPQ